MFLGLGGGWGFAWEGGEKIDMELEQIILISIIISYIILILYEILKRKKVKELYVVFKEKSIQAFDEDNYFNLIIREFNDRTRSSGWLRWKLLIEKKNAEYYSYISLGYFASFSLFFPRLFGWEWGVALPLSMIIFISLLILNKRKLKNFSAMADYFALALMTMVIVIMLLTIALYLLEGSTQPLFTITPDNINWFLALSQISFTFAVGLFLVVSITNLVNDAKKGVKRIQDYLISEIISNKIKSLSTLFKTKSFKTCFRVHGRVSIIESSSRLLMFLLISFILFGSSILTQSESNSFTVGIISSNDALTLFLMLMIFTVIAIYQIYDSTLKLEKNISVLYE